MDGYCDFLKLTEDRFSVRSFSDRKIEKEMLDKILRAGYVAPTACNKQPQKIIIVESEEALKKFRKCTECHFNAPLALIVCYDRERCWKRQYDGKSSGDIDASIVTSHMMLEAASLGIGTTWVMYFIPEAVREEFNIPDNIEPTAILTMGYPSAEAKPYPGHSAFRDMNEILVYNQFN